MGAGRAGAGSRPRHSTTTHGPALDSRLCEARPHWAWRRACSLPLDLRRPPLRPQGDDAGQAAWPPGLRRRRAWGAAGAVHRGSARAIRPGRRRHLRRRLRLLVRVRVGVRVRVRASRVRVRVSRVRVRVRIRVRVGVRVRAAISASSEICENVHELEGAARAVRI